MAGITNFSYSPLPSLSSSKPAKHFSNLFFSAGFLNSPIQFFADASEVRKLVAVTRYRGGSGRRMDIVRDDDDDDEEEEEESTQEGNVDREYDPNLDFDRIQSPTVRVLDEENNMIGVMSLREAARSSENSGLILAIVSTEADPPVVRLFQEKNYRKHKYEKQKKKKMKRTGTKTKEVKMGHKIETHDYLVRLKQAKKFLKEGSKVKAIVNIKGRDPYAKDVAIELLRKFQSDLGQMAMEEAKNFLERNIFLVLTPNKAVIEREEKLRQKEENESGQKTEQLEEKTEQLEENTEQLIETGERTEQLNELDEKTEQLVDTEEKTEANSNEEISAIV